MTFDKRKVFNLDIKRQVVSLYLQGYKSAVEIAKQYNIGVSTVYAWANQIRQLNHLETVSMSKNKDFKLEELLQLKLDDVAKIVLAQQKDLKEQETCLKERDKELKTKDDTIYILKKALAFIGKTD